MDLRLYPLDKQVCVLQIASCKCHSCRPIFLYSVILVRTTCSVFYVSTKPDSYFLQNSARQGPECSSFLKEMKDHLLPPLMNVYSYVLAKRLILSLKCSLRVLIVWIIAMLPLRIYHDLHWLTFGQKRLDVNLADKVRSNPPWNKTNMTLGVILLH